MKQVLLLLVNLILIFTPIYGQSQGRICSEVLTTITELDLTRSAPKETPSETPSETSDPRLKQDSLDDFKEQIEAGDLWANWPVVSQMKQNIRSKIETTCRNPRSCSPEQITNIVETSVVDSFSRVETLKTFSRQIRSYAILISVSVGIAYGNHVIKADLPQSLQFTSDFVSLATSIGLLKLGAPFWDYVGGLLNLGSHRIKGNKSFFRDSGMATRLDERYRRLQGKFTPWQQTEMKRVNDFMKEVESNSFAAIESTLDKGIAKGRVERASVRLALIAKSLRTNYPELTGQDFEILNRIRVIFTNPLQEHVKNGDVEPEVFDKLYELTMQSIEKLDPEDFKKKDSCERYHTNIRLWLDLPQISGC